MLKRLYTELKVNDLIIDHNFACNILHEINSCHVNGDIRIQKKYYQALNKSFGNHNKIAVSLGFAKDDLHEVFNGEIININEGRKEFNISALNHFNLNDSFVKTFEDTTPDTIFKELVNIDYRLQTDRLKKFISDSTKKKAFKNLINTLQTMFNKEIFYYSHEDKIIITNALTGNIYNEEDLTILKTGSNFIKILPVPALKIGDVLVIKGLSLIVKSIRINIETSYSNYICGI